MWWPHCTKTFRMLCILFPIEKYSKVTQLTGCKCTKHSGNNYYNNYYSTYMNPLVIPMEVSCNHSVQQLVGWFIEFI